MISLDVISDYRLHSLQDQWGVGILSKVIQEQQLYLEELPAKLAGVGEKLDLYA